MEGRTQSNVLFVIFHRSKRLMALRTGDGKIILPVFGSQVQAESWLGEIGWQNCFVGQPLAGRNLLALVEAAHSDGFTHFAINPPPVEREPAENAPIVYLIHQIRTKVGV